jgi:hypothetical protein
MDTNHESHYVTELMYLGNGRPVWEPNPDALYDCVMIGDVGYFKNGKFVPLFNVLPTDNSTRRRRALPFPQPDFPPLHLGGNPTTDRRNPLAAGVHALEKNLTFSISGGVVRLAFGFIIMTEILNPPFIALDQCSKETFL